jgi:peptide/nickel transport system substrate-binding protein
VLNSIGYRASFRFAPDGNASGERGIQAGFNGWIADFATPSGFFVPTLTCRAATPAGGSANAAAFCDPAIDREIARAQSLQTSDPERASRLWAKVDHDVVDQAPWVAFANGVAFLYRSNRVGNYQFNPQWGVLLDQLWVR